jgi:MFS family permease
LLSTRAIILTKTSASAITSFIPTIISALELAHTHSHILLLVAPPYIVTTIVSLLISHHSDKGPSRSTHIIIPISVALLGFLVNLSTTNPRTRYGSLFLILGGLYGSYNVALAWISSTLPAPASKRAAALALINTIGNLAQIYAPYLYLKKNGPRYVDAMLANAGFCLMCICATFVLRRLLMTENDVLDMEEREREVDGEEVVVEGEIVNEVERELSFRYVL